MAEITYCEWLTGFPEKFYDFIASFETNGNAVEFYSSAPIEVDWGTGKWLKYEKGVVHGFQAHTYADDPVVIRASEPVEEFRFGSAIAYDNSYLECNIHKAFDLITANKLCYRLEIMERFSFFGTNKVKDFTSAWEDCTELIEFEGMDTTEVVYFKRTWKNCNKLVKFPSVYARTCVTVEEAWMGCTEMLSFPIIGVEKCRNFKSAWRGNTKLVDFPLIDTGAGTHFDHAWAYCINLLDFPVLNYENAVSLNHAFAYNYKNRTLGAFNSKVCKDFTGLFERNLALECITELDTRAIDVDEEGVLLSKNMFLDDCNLVRPDVTEQAELVVGSFYQNPEPCYFDAGRSTFFAVIKSTASDSAANEVCNTGESFVCTFKITGLFETPGKADFEVDWGDGVFLPYNEGICSGIPIHSGIIQIRSEEDVHQITFLSDTFVDISIKRGKTLRTCTAMARDKKRLLAFSIYGNMIATDYSFMLTNNSNLTNVDGVDYSYAETLESTFENCYSIITINELSGIADLRNCKIFTNTFKGCSGISFLPSLITTMGEYFESMFENCISLICIHAIDTTNQKTTTNMFANTPMLYRPNSNEKPRILLGEAYSNGGNCGSPFDMMFIPTGTPGAYDEVSFTVDVEVAIDKGDGIYVPEGPGQITYTPTATSYVSGDVSTISFDTDTFLNVIFFNAEFIESMDSVFAGLLNLEVFNSVGISATKSWAHTFEGCTGLISFGCTNYEESVTYESMFYGCTALIDVGYMNTINGTDFDYMYAGCTLLGKNEMGLKEINTLQGEFDKFWIACTPTFFDCDPATLYVCDDDRACDSEYGCEPGTTDETFPCFAAATMFEGWTSDQIPNEADRISISSKAHWKEGVIL